jgi:phage terminase Nu1 subunit (DNA packaging protein)
VAGEDDKAKGQTITMAQAATLLNRSTSWVQKLVTEGYIVKVGTNQYSVVAIVRGILAYYDDLLEKSNKAAAASRATDARTREIELRIAERRRDLIPQEDARAVVGEMAAMVKAEFSGLPARYTRDMAERRRLEQEIDGSFERIAAAARAAGAALATGSVDMATEPEA